MGRESDTRSAQAWELAGRQHGVVTRRQLLALGFGPRSIQHRVERGRLFRVGLGVYAVGWPALNQKRRWMAAVLAGGEGAALSHRSAAELWQIGGQAHRTGIGGQTHKIEIGGEARRIDIGEEAHGEQAPGST